MDYTKNVSYRQLKLRNKRQQTKKETKNMFL